MVTAVTVGAPPLVFYVSAERVGVRLINGDGLVASRLGDVRG